MSSWIENEFKEAVFPDHRLKSRVITLTSQLSEGFGQSIPMACQDWAATKAAYRFLDNDRLNEAHIMESHFSATASRVAGTEGPILVLHDTSEFAYTRNNDEIGKIRKLRRNPAADMVGGKKYFTQCGILMHASLVVSPEGLPLGLSALKLWTRKDFTDCNKRKKKVNPTRVPIEEKESFRWLENLRLSTNRLGSPERCVHIADREGDMYELFNEAFETQSYFLVRICVNRRTTDQLNVYEQMKTHPLGGVHKITFFDEKGKSVETELDIKFKNVTLKPSDGRKAKLYGPKPVSIITAKEVKGRKTGRPLIDWKLVTNLPVANLEEAIEKLQWYALRWRIEVYFKILKSGCRAEDSKLRSSSRLSKLISIFCILSWRVFWLTMMNRETENVPATISLTETEIRILDQLFPRKDARKRKNLSEYVEKIARLGGYLARSSDPPPGNQVIWRGMRKLFDIHIGVEMASAFVGN